MEVFIPIIVILAASLYWVASNKITWITWIQSLSVRLGRKKHRRFFKYSKEYMPKTPTIFNIGVLSSPNERFFEKRLDVKLPNETDGVVFWGVDWNQNEIVAKVVRRADDIAEVCLLLRIGGRLYQLPSDPDSRKCFVDPTNNRIFSAGRLNLQCLWPMRRWRLSFNGLLKKVGSNDDDDNIHVKFSFTWHALSAIHDNLHDFENRDVASALESKEFKKILKDVDMERFNSTSNSYEQWGMFCGTVMVEGGAVETALWMWGSRRRIMGLEEPLQDRIRLDICMKDGLKTSIEVKNVPGMLSNYVNGHCHYKDFMEYLITSCQTDFLKMAKEERFLEEFLFVFSSARTRQNHIMKMKPTSECISLQGISQRTLLYPMRVRFGEQEGRALLQYSCRDHHTLTKNIRPPLLLMDKANDEFPLLVAFDDVCCQSSRLVGGKGFSLGRLTALSLSCHHRFHVPKFIILTTQAYDHHIVAHPNIKKAINSLKSVIGRNERKEVDDACSRVQSAFAKTELGQTTKKSLVESLERIFGDEFADTTFAVRSSACGEDGEELSAAGQMSTILGVKGIHSLCEAILTCWASHFKYECIQYERQNGQPVTSPMAVVIQEMINAETAGVLFSIHPVTNNPKFMCITANYGLGESVVSGRSEPDTITLKRLHDGKTVDILELEIGSKTSQVVLKGNGVEEIEIDNSEASRCCLPKKMALKLGEIGLVVEDCFCNARDIEWAIKDQNIYLLQARPITTLDAISEFEAIHDQDAAFATDGEYWTTSNIGEVLPQALSPLAISVFTQILDKNNTYNMQDIDSISITQPIVYNQMYYPTSHRRLFFNLIDVIYKRNDEVKSPGQKAIEVGMFGRVLDDAEIYQMGIQRYGYLSKFKHATDFLSFLIDFVTGYSRWALKNQDDTIKEFVNATPKGRTSDDLYCFITEILEGLRVVDSRHVQISISSAVLNAALLMLLGRNKNEWDVELYSDFAKLLSSCNNVESADVPEAIKELANVIRKENGHDFSAMSTKDAAQWLQKHNGKVGQQYAQFLEKHGHRGFQEFDFAAKPWRMDAESLVVALQASVTNGENNSKRKTVCSVEESIKTIKTKLGYFAKFILSKLIRRCRIYVGYREQSKSKYIKMIDICRAAYYDLGHQMVEEGRLPKQDFIFFLTHEEIEELIATRSPTLISKAVKRQKSQSKLKTLAFSDIVHGIPKPCESTEQGANEIMNGSTVSLKGTPVSYGIAKARARVILKLEDAKSIRCGEILVCKATDIGWSPYFPILAGVVTELGGLVSHGAVVARECGIPCIVGVERATDIFKTGDLLMMDATNGVLLKIHEEPVDSGRTS